ncbi:coiled-coil domain-containing protein 57 isoform X2 [Agelaius phoeniceus]|uniref:coiled-coil domain-containing protein 57 isoform X2 n=1 Tax=Agelaius phoeniceus TaxID=39638 RepID=UPI004054FB93
MAQVLAVFWEKGVLLNETGAPKERARAHTKQRRGCCVRVVRTERGECEEERTRCRFLEANAMRGTEKQEGRQTGAGTASVSEGRSGGGCGPSAAAPWRRVRPRRAPPAAARAACSRERSRAGVRAVRTPVATGLFHRKTARSHGIPLCRRSKQQLSLAAEREWILKQSKMQAELNWQQLCENAECNWYQKSEDPTHSLSSSREEVQADLQKTDYRLHEVKSVLSAFTVEREQTIQASFNHSISPEGEKQIFQYDDESSLYKYIPALEIKKLQEQNASLRAAIAQMRKEMESLDEQMLSSLPQTEGRQLAEQGSLNTNKISTGTTPSNIKVSSTKLDCLVNPDTEEGPEPKVLEENMVNFGQQPADVGTGNGCQYSVKHTLQGMQNKLKEAARKISILSQEKRQLIEMGNRLRAELGMVLKEGVWHPVSSKHCTVCVASGSLLPRELVKRTQCQLSVLKHLQHRLTTQELQCTRQQHPSRFSSLTACSSLKEEEAPSSCGEETELPSSEVWIDFSIENHGPDTFSATKEDTTTEIVQTQLLSQSPSHVQQVQLSSSRMQNFCQILDTGSSHSLLSPRKNTSRGEFEVVHSIKQSEEFWQNVKAKDKLETSAEDLTVRGTRLEVQQKLKSRSLFCAHLLKPKISSSMTKIRNYNIKD